MNVGSSGLAFTGLASGLDTEAIISKILEMERQPITRLNSQQMLLQGELNIMQQYQGKVSALQSAISSLTNLSAFTSVSASSSDDEIATITGATGSTQGTYDIEISQLAQAQKLRSKGFADSTSALNQSGTFYVNNFEVNVNASDSLSTIAQKINSLGAGVTASILNGGTNNTYLTITSQKTGTDSVTSIRNEGTDTVASTGLELINTSSSIRRANSANNGMYSNLFSSSATTLGEELNLSTPYPSSASLMVNGHLVSIDFSSDTLQSVATKIKAADPTVNADIISETVDGTTKYRLEVSGATTPVLTDDQDIFASLGLLSYTPSHEMVQAKDANYKIDNLALISQTNTLTNVIPGATISLLKANATTPEKATLTLSKDVSEIKSNINNFVTSFNAMIDYIDQNSKMDSTTFVTGALFGNTVAHGVRNTAISQVTNIVQGLTTTLDTLAELGVTLGSDNKLTVDDSKLTTGLTENPDGVAKLFQSAGTPDNTAIRYIASTSKTKINTNGYDIQITQQATKGSATATMAMSGVLTDTEKITFGGKMFGTSIDLFLTSGQSIDSIVEQINTDSRLRDNIAATNEGGSLVITSKRWGSLGSFTVTSDKEAGAGTTGIGTTAINADGLDVAGTIGGEAADGLGQTLTGKTGNTYTEGLQILVSANSTGSYGSIVFTRGIASSLGDYLTTVLDTSTGDIPKYNESMQTQIDDLTKRMEEMDALALTKEQSLREKFARMEEAMSKLQSQSSQMTSLLSTL